MNTPVMRTIINRIVHILLLTYGGVGLLQWFLTTALGGAAEAGSGGLIHWLRDSALALPLVAVVVLVSARRAHGAASTTGGELPVLFAVVMAAGSLLHLALPQFMEFEPHSHAPSSLPFAQHLLLILLLSWAYAVFVGRGLSVIGAWVEDAVAGLRMHPRLASGVWTMVGMLAVLPALLLTGTRPAVAATTFPDHPIHPKGSLRLVARELADGTKAFVADGYGVLGTRPTIEMTEGETLNITLYNELEVDVSLHVHGVHYDLDSDGTRHNNSFVRPGQEYTYQWRARKGTAGYWHYHDHVLGDNEGTGGIAAGLYGGLIVRRPGDAIPARTFVLVFHNYSINGRLAPDTPTPVAYQGELVEFLVISYMDELHTFHLHGHRWLTDMRATNPDSAADENAGVNRVDNYPLAPGDSFGFRTIAGYGVEPGMWMYHCHVQSHSGGMQGFFQVLPPLPPADGTPAATP